MSHVLAVSAIADQGFVVSLSILLSCANSRQPVGNLAVLVASLAATRANRKRMVVSCFFNLFMLAVNKPLKPRPSLCLDQVPKHDPMPDGQS